MPPQYEFLVGTVVGFQGLHGEVKIRPSTNNPDLLLEITRVRVVYARGLEPANPLSVLTIDSARVEKKMLLLSFEEHEDRTAVEHLEGAIMYANAEELLPLEEEEFWIKDLVGLDVFTTEGEFVGKVQSIIYGGNDLIEIRRETDPPNKTILVPFVKHLVPVVDLKSNRVEVVNMPGLLEPQ